MKWWGWVPTIIFLAAVGLLLLSHHLETVGDPDTRDSAAIPFIGAIVLGALSIVWTMLIRLAPKETRYG